MDRQSLPNTDLRELLAQRQQADANVSLHRAERQLVPVRQLSLGEAQKVRLLYQDTLLADTKPPGFSNCPSRLGGRSQDRIVSGTPLSAH